MKPDEKTVQEVGPIWRELYGKLWHTTPPDRFASIMACGAILPEPNIHNSKRWKTGCGEKHYPYVRHLGGISLFDFYQFSPKIYEQECRLCNWREFVPYRQKLGGAVWIEIDRLKITSAFISASELIARRSAESALGHDLMPYIEAAHLGPLPAVAFKRALFVHGKSSEFHDLDVKKFDSGAYSELIKDWRSTR